MITIFLRSEGCVRSWPKSEQSLSLSILLSSVIINVIIDSDNYNKITCHAVIFAIISENFQSVFAIDSE